jgi:hypothetical protein
VPVGRPFPVSASSSVELVLVGPHRPVHVVAATAQAAYLTVTDESRTIICLAVADAIRVPCALIVQSNSLPQPQAGTTGLVGGGTLSVGDMAYRVARWWRPPRPRGLRKVTPARLAGAVRWLTRRVADPLDTPGRAAVADLVHALRAGAAPDDAVARLLGRGPGLTPTGDDVLAGALVALRALGSPAADPLAAAVAAAAPRLTTTVSAALLTHAAHGECIPQLADLLDAFNDTAVALPRAAGALLAVGHCSGAGLLHGVLVGVAIAHAPLAFGVLPQEPVLVPTTLPLPVASTVVAA